MRHLGGTLPFRGPDGEVVSGSIAEVAYRRLGGPDQWVLIRGESVANPSLILLHGGPGLSETRFFRRFNAPLEKSFTVVYWDQRGAGQSFYSDIPRSSMTVEQFISDLDDLVDAVRERLGRTKVVIFGHSWGSALGTLYEARFPEKVAAYVGSGQYGDAAAGETASYAYGLAEAERRGNRRALNKLREIGPPPHTAEQLMTERTSVTRLEGGMRPRAWPNLARIALSSPRARRTHATAGGLGVRIRLVCRLACRARGRCAPAASPEVQAAPRSVWPGRRPTRRRSTSSLTPGVPSAPDRCGRAAGGVGLVWRSSPAVARAPRRVEVQQVVSGRGSATASAAALPPSSTHRSPSSRACA